MHIQPQQRIYICFFLFAVSMGATLSRLPDLQEALQIDHGVVFVTAAGLALGADARSAKAAPRGQSRKRTPWIKWVDGSDHRHQPDEIGVARIDDPVDRATWIAMLERGDRRDRVNHVAERSQTDDQESWRAFVHDDEARLRADEAIRVSRSRVE